MAATDQLYRKQKMLDIVFAVSGIVTLLSMIGMFWQDYFREFKTEQRAFRDVEYAMAERGLLDVLPQPILNNIREAESLKDADKLNEAYDALGKYLDSISDPEKDVATARKKVADMQDKFARQIHDAQVSQATADTTYRSIKATYDSKESLYNIARDETDRALAAASSDSEKQALKAHIQRLKDDLDNLRQQRDSAKLALDQATESLHQAEFAKAKAELELSDADAALKKVTADLDRLDKLAQQKHWKLSDRLLSMPVIDAFNSPYRIQEYTLTEYPIDYSFKYVTRYDRCTTCHLGMEKANFESKALKELRDPPKQLQANLAKFHEIMASPPEHLKESVRRFKEALADRKQHDKSGQGFDLDDLPKTVPPVSGATLTDPRITQFAAHPRLDLFVDGNSPHPAEKFGCTSCHSGQGSSTDFANAAHAPNSPEQEEEWVNAHGWHSSHFWDFPMLAKRFGEAQCLKCHHQVTDLVRYGNQVEAPKLMRGFQLVRDNGCFGCHEIAGVKRGREIGPDLRLEPGIPLDKMDAADRAKLEADTANPPGTLRKVGPSLFRLAEKTNEDWVTRWIWRPRGFRPDTKMPHFYGLSNNNEEGLKNTGENGGVDQRDFPAAEVRAVAYYLMHESGEYLKGDDAWRRTNLAVQKWHKEKEQKGALTDPEKKELAEIEHRLEKSGAPLLELRLDPGQKPVNISEQITDMDGKPVQLPDAAKGDDARKELTRGRKLFSEKGCLACHFHEGTTKGGGGDVPDVVSEANFGPDLSHVAAKLGTKAGDQASARRWLVQWILNPQSHHPRTRMPYTHLTVDEAAAVAAWLLSEGKDSKGEEPPEVADPMKTYKDLARLYLAKARTNQELNDFFASAEDAAAADRAKVWLSQVRPDADETVLQGGLTEENLKLYVGKKAINRYGCFGCHNVPGFETAKPIGTPLNDWGKKDPERLAFEDAAAYVHDHHTIAEHVGLTKEQAAKLKELQEKDADSLTAKEKKELSELKKVLEIKNPYEQFYFDLLNDQHREGFLHEKLDEPRSYDYHRPRVWDDRLRMPQFRFARSRRLQAESDEEYDARQRMEEAEAREAVMTFVLGLVAEPVPAEYVSKPAGDRLAEVKGRHVLEQANCIGCHQVRPGVYEFKLTDEATQRLQDSYAAVGNSLETDFTKGPDAHYFLVHNAWAGTEPPKGVNRLRAFGVDFQRVEGLYEGSPPTPVITLADALRFPGKDAPIDLPANSPARLPDELLNQSAPFGGAFADLMVGYQTKARSQMFTDAKKARSSLPPQLFREGERTRPDWLFQFLRNPTIIRPQNYMMLRMPRFNLSDEEFMTLVNYFNAVDRAGNPGIGMEYPYVAGTHDDELYWRQVTEKYRRQLGKDKLDARAKQFEPLWVLALQDQLTLAKGKLAAAEDAVKNAKDADKKKAEDERDQLQKDVKALEDKVQKKDVSDLRREWEETGVYASDAYRLLTATDPSTKLCIACHQVGNVPSPDPQGPNLALASARLRPEWSRRWLSFPDRMMYPTVMPQNFPNGKEQYKAIFDGSSLDQVTALRDVLMNLPKVADRPENRYQRPVTGGTQ